VSNLPTGCASGDPGTHLASDRSCGSCRACCTLPDIPELNKPINTPCPNVSTDPDRPGCTRYDSRPDVCRGFKCGWLNGLGDPEDRPDRLGIMWQQVDLGVSAPARSDASRLAGLAFVEVWPGALQQPRAVQWLRRFEAARPGQILTRLAGARHFSLAEVRVRGKPLASHGSPGTPPTAATPAPTPTPNRVSLAASTLEAKPDPRRAPPAPRVEVTRLAGSPVPRCKPAA